MVSHGAHTTRSNVFLPWDFGGMAMCYEAAQQRIEGLVRDHAALVKDNAELRGENARLEARVRELERTLSLDSTNSGKPPSSDGYQKKANTEKRTKSLRGKSKKPSGGQPGHPGKTLQQTDTPDHIVNHHPEQCSKCGADEFKPGTTYIRRQVFDLPEPKPLEVTEHRSHLCCCSKCGAANCGEFPAHVKAPVQYGARLSAMVSYLHYAQFIPEKRLAETIADLFSVSLSTATVSAMCRRAAARFAPVFDAVTEIIRLHTPVKHMDETGMRIGAATRWVHVLCTQLLTSLRLGTRRGDVEHHVNGIIVHDDYAPYFTITDVIHAACNAHHMRELVAVADIDKEPWALLLIRLLDRAYRVRNFARANHRTINPSLLALFSSAWDRILDQAIAFHDTLPELQSATRGRKKRRKGHNLARRLQKNKHDCLRFLHDLQVPYSNNQGERDLRMCKLRQKVSGGFRTELGAIDFLLMRSIIATGRKQGWNIMEMLLHRHPRELIPKLRC